MSKPEGFFVYAMGKKKETGLSIDSFRNERITLFSMNNKANKEVLKKVLTDDEIKKIDKDFERFYKLVLDACRNTESQVLLKQYKEEIKSTFFLYMFELIEFHPLRQAKNADDETIVEDLLKDENLRDGIILRAKHKLFFLADVVIAFVGGDDKGMKELVDRYKLMSGRKIDPNMKKHYDAILSIHNELIKNYKKGQRCSLSAAVHQYNNKKKLGWNDNKCKSIRETISKLIDKGTLQYPA